MKTKQKAELGDFQTPLPLARAIARMLARQRVSPAAVLEPTCGEGSFLVAAVDQFRGITKAVGLDINETYVAAARSALGAKSRACEVQLVHGDFFRTDWRSLLDTLPDPLLVVGNPPWVTNAHLGSLGSSNLPAKSNFQKHSGLDALTGKSNFDISEWMLIRLLEWLSERRATLAMLCKTAVARKVLLYAWKSRLPLEASSIRLIDAEASFGAAVDACLLVCTLSPSAYNCDCSIYEHIGAQSRTGVFGYRDGRLIANAEAYERWKHLVGRETIRWRSGIKHDCTRIMEFSREGDVYRNGLGELVSLEDRYLYPMLKGSKLANSTTENPSRWMLVTQRTVGQDTSPIESSAPKTWGYLQSHADILDRRASSIYRNRPRFSVFGVGPYSFTPAKVAISGFYKKLAFAEVGSHRNKPIVLDDTSYFLPCYGNDEARYIASLLNTDVARELLSAFVFWDSKRPITIDVLRRVDLLGLATELGSENTMRRYLSARPETSAIPAADAPTQKELFPTY